MVRVSRAGSGKIVVLFIGCALCIILLVDDRLRWRNFDYTVILPTDLNSLLYNSNKNESESQILFDHCKLPYLDPWDPSIKKWLVTNIPEPVYNGVPIFPKNCKPKWKQFSQIRDGKLYIAHDREGENVTCLRRCCNPKNDYDIDFGEWIEIVNGSRPECDVFEIECKDMLKNGTIETFYKFIHAQIYRPDPPPKPEEVQPSGKPDVHIILLDSVSLTQFIRSMPKTLHALREYFEAIGFRYLNKMGLNSTPNGFALLLGKSINTLPKSPVSRGHQNDYNNTEEWCSKPLDDDQFIGYRFQEDGYKTLMSEDWSQGVFNFPGCKGFAKPPTTHYMRPFQLRIERLSRHWVANLKNITIYDQCRETFYFQMEYLKRFIDAYPDKPKFSMTWMTYLAHDSRNNLYHTDDYFYNFFKKYREKLNNSYIFVMGDHGNRFGGISYTKHGDTEDKNPLLFMSVPANKRRDPEIINMLKQNTQELITHYDVYATLLEINKPPNPRFPNPLIRGSSLFHPLPQPRTCDLLGIPFRFCMCDFERIKLPRGNEVAPEASKLLLANMNEKLREFNQTSPCSLLTLNPEVNVKVEEFKEKGNVTIYQIQWETLPGRGRFNGFVMKNNLDGSYTILSGRFPRLNKYGHQAKCAAGAKYESYCFCKDLLNATTKPPKKKSKLLKTTTKMANKIKMADKKLESAFRKEFIPETKEEYEALTTASPTMDSMEDA